MLSIKEWMELVDYRITEGSNYCWNCYGDRAYRLDSWNQDQEGYTISIVFDTQTHEVYEATAYDYKRERAYRLINPEFADAHREEAKQRDVVENQAWDDVNYVDLEADDDFIQKCLSIVADEDYDTRVSIPMELPDNVMLELMLQAHEKDITLNQHIENVIRIELGRMKDEVAQHGAESFKEKYQKKIKGKSKDKKKKHD